MNLLEPSPAPSSKPPEADETPPPRLARGTKELTPIDPASLQQDDVMAISHDLRGPLSVVALEVTMLEELLPKRHEIRVALRRIGRNLTYLDNLIQDLLDAAAIDASRFAVQREPIELSGLVCEVVDRTVSTRDLERVSVTTIGSLVVAADERRIQRVVANLVQNALKYAPVPSPVAVVVDRHDTMARVSVIDRGPGMAPDEASRVFEKFRRCRSTAHLDGAGLGLYVSRKIIDAHEGRIAVDSTIGRGSRFYFELPLLHA